MDVQLSTEPLTAIESDWLIVPVPSQGSWSARLSEFDGSLGGVLSRLRDSRDLKGSEGELVPLLHVPGITAEKVLLVGVGDPQQTQPAHLFRAWITAVRNVSKKSGVRVAVDASAVSFDHIELPLVVQLAAEALEVGSVGQDLYKAEKELFPPVLAKIVTETFLQELKESCERGVILGNAVNLTRELVNRHPGELFPESFAKRALSEAQTVGLEVLILDEPAIRKEKMGSLLGVAQGSVCPPRVIVLRHRGGNPHAPWLGLCGKGVTFDSGGLSLKPSDSMKTMKGDMAGAATVLGAMTAMARLKLPVNVIGVVGLVENMPSGTAYKLGEVLTARNGVTIEVHNTDAEGRLVLADVLSYTVDLGASRLVDLATLTGSCVVALGTDIAGVFSNDDAWRDEVLDAAKAAGEDAWPMPMCSSFDEQIKSDVADVKNVGTRWGGAITAAKFLQKFVGETPWVHLDIAGPAFAESSKPYQEGGGTGAFVVTLVELARRWGGKSTEN